MPNSQFTIRLTHGIFDDDNCWEAHALDTVVYAYSTDIQQVLYDIGKELSDKYPLDVKVPIITLDDIFDSDISAMEELDLIRQATKVAC